MPEAEGGGVSTGGKGVVKPPPEEEPQPKPGGKGVVRPPVRYDTPTAPAPRIHDPAIADRIIVSADRASQIFRDTVTDSDLYNMPDTTAYTTFVKNDLVASTVKNEVYAFFSSIYGTENASQLIAADLLPEPQRSRTFAALAELSQNAAALNAAAGSPFTRENPQEVLQRILSGQTAIEELTEDEIRAVGPMTDEMLANLEDLPDQGISGDIKRAIAVGVSGNTALSLTEDDVELLKTLKDYGLGDPSTTSGLARSIDIDESGNVVVRPGAMTLAGGQTAETPELNQVGIEQIRQLGEGVIVLDLDDAKADPARAFAVRLFLEQNYPELEIQYGREGVVGSLLDKLGAPLDYITAPFGAGLRQLSEFGEGVENTPENRQRLLGVADQIEKQIQEGDREGYMALRKELMPIYNLSGGVDPEKGGSWETEAQRAIVQFRDQGTEEVGWNEFVTQMDENTRPRIIGFGFGESFTKATDTLPGDSWYAPAYLSSSLLAALVADPLNWAPGLIGGIKAARGIPKLSRAKYEKMVVDSAEELRLASATGVLDDAGKPIYALSQEDAVKAARAATRGVVTENDLYPIVGRGWVKNSVYRHLAKSPEELMSSRRFIRAGRRLNRLRDTVGEGEFFTAMNRWFGENWRRGGGLEVARSLSQAQNADDMGATLMRAVLGLDNSSLPIDDLVSELDDVNRSLRVEKLGGGAVPVSPDAATITRYEDLPIAEGDYVYHLTTPEAVEGIAREGLFPNQTPLEWMRGAFFADNPQLASELIPPAAGGWAVLRVRRGAISNLEATDIAGEFRSATGVDPQNLEVLTPGGTWQSLAPSPRSADDILALETRRLHLEEVINGRDYARPLEMIPSAKQLRQIERQAGASYGKYSDALELSLMDKAGYAAREATRTLMKPLRVFERMYRPTGASEVIIMPHMLTRSQAVRAPGGIIAVNQAEESLTHLANIGRLFGIKDRRINQILAPWRNLIDNPNSADGYDVLKQVWESLVDESPRLPSFGKTELRQMWKGSASERSPSWLTVVDADGSHQAPVVFRTDPVTGVRIGKPAIEADQLTTWRTPALQDMREYLSLVQSHMKVWKKAGGIRGAAATMHGITTTAWSYVNSFWRTTTLGFRLFGALPARIFNEQALRIAAYDFASTYWHPMEWFLSTKTGSALDSAGFNALFRDHPGAALGVMVDNMQQHPRFFRRTRNIVEPFDGETYFRAYAERIDRMNASPSVWRWHLPNMSRSTPADIVDDLAITPVEGKEGVVTITGWHGSRAGGVPVNVEPDEMWAGGFHFGTKQAATDRVQSGEMLQTHYVSVLDENGEVLWDDMFDNYDEAATKASRVRSEHPEYEVNIESSDLDNIDMTEEEALEWEQGGQVFPVEVRGKFYGVNANESAADIAASWGGADAIDEWAAIRAKMKAEGYHGFVYTNVIEDPGKKSVVVFDPKRVTRVDDPAEATLASMRGGRHADAGADWLRTYDDYGMDPRLAVERTQEEIRQLLGTGEGADLLRVAMQRGAVEIDGKVYKTGTKQFADKLQELSESGRWTPGAKYFNASAGDYLPLDRTHMTAFRDGLFRTFYSAPDLALSRSPMYRQLASREYRNLISRGYSATRARELARARAARGTADMMFTIGAKTSGEYFLRNLNPFFPAYRELGTTWLKRLPLRVGEGHWALGSAALVRRADIWFTFFKEMGLIQEQPDGGVTVPIPGIGGLMAALTGREVGFNAGTPLESIAGILPVPTHLFDRDEEGNLLPVADRVKGIFPTLGGPATFLLGQINELSKDRLDALEDFLTLYGADTSLGPLAVDRFAEAFGFTLPWMSNTTTEMHQRMRTWASIDGQRIAYAGMIEEFGRPPDPNTPEGQKWAEEWINRGEHYAMWSYIIRGVSGMTLPFSLQVEDEGKAEVAEMWSFLNGLPRDESGMFRSAYIRSYLADNPEMEPYMVGKNLDTRPADDPNETRDEYFDAIEREEIKPRSAADQAVFALGSNVMFDIQARINAFYAAAESPVDFIMNFEAKAAIDKYQDLRDDYLAFHNQKDLPRNRIEGQTTSFASMWEEWEAYQAARDGDTTPRLSFEQRRILAIADLEDDIFKYFGPGESSEDYYKIKDQIYEKLNYQPRSEIGMAQQWYFGDVQEAFYDRRNELFDRLDKLTLRPGAGDETSWQKAKVYQEIRDLSAEFDHTFVHPRHPEWGEFPSPEAYSFIKLQQTDPEAAERQVAEWAMLPANYLTNFQREQVGYAIPEGKEDAANELANFITENEVEFDKAVERFNISTSSTVYEINRDRYDRAYVNEAKRLGLGDYWRYANAPEAVRIGNALNLSERTGTWNLALQRAKELSGRIESTEYVGSEGGEPGPFYSATGDSAVALEARERMNDTVTTWRRNDKEFDTIIGNFQVWLSGDDRPLTQQDLVDKLFFGKTLITVR